MSGMTGWSLGCVKRIGFGIAATIVFIMISWWMRPVVVVGQVWPASERVACCDISHDTWDDLLRSYVDSDGNVNYTSWKASTDNQQRLDDYLASLSRLDETQAATRSQTLAFWINAYNAVTVRGILNEYPTTSIKNHVSYLWGYNIWRDLKLMIGDRRLSLGAIEHSILRQMGEPRIHFALVCASRGCPRLLNQAYSAENLEEQLESNARAFFADPTKCQYDAERNELYLSPIVHWYANDFGSTTSERWKRLTAWLPEETARVIHADEVRILYLAYDWNLNDQATVGPPLPPF